ncbi:Enamine deaminase RidA, house cleaning of reactive enamine intermediates, YjgF/YER057c/UK114 family [Mariniphaga anaerophila]|uniref:Enamine deaminase RidA, house cleaning of reactive enamine intermediates, YjgF/YER057c/UK114 family n=1 Tax=Mariniphaga anaerophila TaxID=1484053 RepID=A0A1M5F7Q9_9BACT|nr:RidA family protein [Mariniphaga anaerophila]SHF87650.1 Enamine deaminase RidA, house cleaning of reactive enamine intermediates, YjgF/YER057c/UK114 family [Mariniphaga anaerophila]
MNTNKIIRLNPENIPPPVGNYSHVTIIPKNSDLYTFSGQIGIDNNGNIPEKLSEQVTLTFRNIQQLLDSQTLTPDNVIKVNIWATEEIDWDFFDNEWEILFGEKYPSMTIAYITALGLPELKIEIEIWAAK